MAYLFTSQRLGFRKWTEDDKVPFASMNRNSQVMEFMPKELSREESDSVFRRINDHFKKFGYGLFATDLLSSNRFIGFIGFQETRFEAYFTPCMEVGFRLHPSAWGQGLATEGGKRCIQFAFENLGLHKICSFTSTANKKAQRVIEKCGLQKEGFFDHPMLEEGHQLRKHVLYHLEKNNF